MPIEAKEEIREELNQVTSMIRDEALKQNAEKKIADTARAETIAEEPQTYVH